MKLKNLAIVSCAAMAIASIAAAQLVTGPLVTSIGSTDALLDIPNDTVASTTVYASVNQVRSYMLAQNSTHTTAPTLTTSGSTCGGSTATVSGADTSGIVTEGSSASTSCVITFAKAFVTAPECFVSINNVADASLKCATSTTALTVTQTSASSNVLIYLVVGVAGG